MNDVKINYKEILRFLLVGLTATIIDFIIRTLFLNYLNPYMDNNILVLLSYTVGFSISCLINYTLSVIFVFKDADSKNKKSMKSFILFIIFAIIGFLIGLGITYLGDYISKVCFDVSIADLEIVEVVKNLDFTSKEFWCFSITFVVSTLIVLFFNYITRKIFIFKNKSNKE